MVIIFKILKKLLWDIGKALLKISCFLILMFFVVYVLPDLFKEKSLRTFLSAKFFVAFKEMTPHQAREIVIQEARHNHELKNIMPHDKCWRNMHVIGNEYFFSVMLPNGYLKEWGYYINPDTGNIRYVNNEYSFVFPTFIDFSRIPVDEKQRLGSHCIEPLGSRHNF